MCEIKQQVLVKIQISWNKYLVSIASIFYRVLKKMQLLDKENIFFTITFQMFPELVPIKGPETILKLMPQTDDTYGLLL